MDRGKKVVFIDDEKHIRQANRQTLELAEMVPMILLRSHIQLKDWSKP